MKRYLSYKDSGIEGIGEIPDEWRIKKLKYVTRTIIDGTHFTPTYVDSGIPFLRVTDIQTRNIDLDIVKYISEEEHKELIMRCNPEKNDLLLSKNGTIGITKVIDWDFSFSIFVSLCLIKFLKHLINPYFFSYFFQSNVVDEQIYGSSKTTSVTNLHLDKIRELLTLIPPLSEQQSIATYLDRKTHQIDTLIEKKEKQIDLLKGQRAAIINQAVTKGLNPNVKLKDSGIEWLGAIPEHWKVKKLKYFGEIVNGSTPKSGIIEYWDGDIMWLTPDDLGKLNGKRIYDSARKITEQGLNSCGTTITPPNSIVLSTRAPIGHICISNIPSCTNQGCKTIVPNFDLCDFNYAYYLLYGQKEELQSLGQGSTFTELSSQKLKDFKIPFPPIPEQKNIAKHLDQKSKEVDGLINNHKKSIYLLKEYRTALISEVVTGKIDVRDSGEHEVRQS